MSKFIQVTELDVIYVSQKITERKWYWLTKKVSHSESKIHAINKNPILLNVDNIFYIGRGDLEFKGEIIINSIIWFKNAPLQFMRVEDTLVEIAKQIESS